MFDRNETIEVKWNLEILGFDRGKRRVLHNRTHNIVVNNGRQFIVENLSASAFGVGTFTRAQNSVVRYMGLGIGGNRQAAPEASTAPLSSAYPTGYAGTNAQTDIDLTVSRLERPVKATPSLWLKQVAAPATYPSAKSVTWSCLFDAADLNLTPIASMPVSEIGLYSSAANPALPNGGAGAYPGTTSAMVAYDNFFHLYKTGFWSLLARWTWTI
jgi:hypothetical protein